MNADIHVEYICFSLVPKETQAVVQPQVAFQTAKNNVRSDARIGAGRRMW